MDSCFFSFYIQTLKQGLERVMITLSSCDNSYKSLPNSTFPPTDRVSELYNYDSLYSSRIVIQLLITTIYGPK